MTNLTKEHLEDLVKLDAEKLIEVIAAWEGKVEAIIKRRGEVARDLAAEVLRLRAEIGELREKLDKFPTAEWFYDPDCMESCFFDVHEVIDHMELLEGKHVIEVKTAAPLPSIWCAVTVDHSGDSDEPLKIDEFETKEAAEQALKGQPHD